ncbi:murein hydrolase activator EnvC family protein, partial [Streptomyces sparsus]
MWFTFAAVALLSWPVPDPHLVRPFDPPAAPWSAGHRGVDLAVEAGAPVRATAAGRVSYAGVIAGRGVVAVAIDGTGDPPLRVTYEPVRATVDTGQRVRAGQTIGVLQAEPSHCAPASCLHWGLRRGTAYLDPLTLSAASPSVLLPVAGVPPSGATHEPAGTGQPDTASRGYTGPLLTAAAAAARVGARQAAPHGRPPP